MAAVSLLDTDGFRYTGGKKMVGALYMSGIGGG